MKIRNLIEDVGGASRVTKRRQEMFDNAEGTSKYYDPISETAKKLHPGMIRLTVSEIRPAGKTAKTIRFEAPALPYFQAGQFLTLKMKIGNSIVTRPYSISSAPFETRGEHPFVEITVRKPKENGFAADELLEHTKPGDVFEGEVGLGEFHYDSIRDAKHAVALAGGSGITPFVSMAKEIRFGKLDLNLTVLYGSVNADDIILKEELEQCACGCVKIVHVLSGDNPDWTGEKGFLSRELIQKYSDGDTSYFICGPQAMYEYVKQELEALQIPKRRIRFEVFGQSTDISQSEDYPSELKDRTFRLKVKQGIHETVIDAEASESIAVALERASLPIHTRCRSGSCGVCRIKVLDGKYYVRPVNDGRRAEDKEFNYVHACSCYPLSDMTVRINIPVLDE